MYSNVDQNIANNSFIQPKKDNLFMIFIICLIVAIVGSFLDFLELKVEIYSYSYSEATNFISYTDKTTGETSYKDGVIVLPMLIIAAVLLFKKKYTVAQILSIIALIIVIVDIATADSSIEEAYRSYVTVNYSIGCFLVTAGVIGCVVIAFLLGKKNKENMPNPPIPMMTQQPMMSNMSGQPYMNNIMPQPAETCMYCGAPKANSTNCPYCGGKY